MEHAIHRELLTRSVRVLVVGCGTHGTGVGTSLPYLHRALLAYGHPAGLDVTFVDDDTVSYSSCRTQPFRESDVGEFRSVVLAERLNAWWGLGWRAVPGTLSGPDQLQDIDIVIGCVPTARVRAGIAAHTAGATGVGYWLDLASNADGAQFVLGEPPNTRNRRSSDRLRVVSELFPEIIEGAFDEAVESRSRGSADPLAGQDAFVCQILASHALMLIAQLFRDRAVPYQGGFVGPRGGVRPLPVGGGRLRRSQAQEPAIEYD